MSKSGPREGNTPPSTQLKLTQVALYQNTQYNKEVIGYAYYAVFPATREKSQIYNSLLTTASGHPPTELPYHQQMAKEAFARYIKQLDERYNRASSNKQDLIR